MSLIKSTMLTQVLSKNVLHPTYSALSTYFRVLNTSTNSIKLLRMLIVSITASFHVQLAVKCIFCALKFVPAIHIVIWRDTFASYTLKNFVYYVTLSKFLHLSSFRLEACLSKLDAINLQLSVNVS